MTSENKARISSALVGVLLVFGIYFYMGHLGLTWIVSGISFIAYYEFLNMLLERNYATWWRKYKIIISLIVGIGAIYLLTWQHNRSILSLYIYIYVFLASALLLGHQSSTRIRAALEKPMRICTRTFGML
jgi:CDP-diglyceride synthetase